MRDAEIKYWDDIAVRGINDNIWKRQEIVRRLLSLPLINQHILEIGCGGGNTFGSISAALLWKFDYMGTDLSPSFCATARKVWGLNAVQADVRSIPYPDNSADLVVALDSLEHVRPDDRIPGYREIDRILKPFGRIAINIPLDISGHKDEFDFGFAERDLFELLHVCNMRLETYEQYNVNCGDEWRHYAWAVGVR